jgi:hypothetical protein
MPAMPAMPKPYRAVGWAAPALELLLLWALAALVLALDAAVVEASDDKV